MNRRILLVMVIVLTLITAVVHLILGGGMVGMMAGSRGPTGEPPVQPGEPPEGFQLPNNGQVPGNGQPPQNEPPPGGAPDGIGFLPLPILFVLNGIGYLALLALLTLPIPYLREHPSITHWALIGYAALTFALYFVVNGFGRFLGNPLAIVSKVAELLLILCTFLHWWAVRMRAMPTSPPAAPTEA